MGFIRYTVQFLFDSNCETEYKYHNSATPLPALPSQSLQMTAHKRWWPLQGLSKMVVKQREARGVNPEYIIHPTIHA